MSPNSPRPSSLRIPAGVSRPGLAIDPACESTPMGSFGAHRLRAKDCRALVTIGRSPRQRRALHSRAHEKQVAPSRPLSSPRDGMGG